MLIGLQGSGKSTFAKKIKEDDKDYNTEIISSDNVRRHLFGDETFQGDNSKVFEFMNNTTKECLKNGTNVIYDATNLSRKRRMSLLKDVKADMKIVYCMATPFERCISFDRNRERCVGYEVIKRAYKQLQIPIKSEGWDEVHHVYNDIDMRPSSEGDFQRLMSLLDNRDVSYGTFVFVLCDLIPYFENVVGFPQDSKYHTFSVSRHIYHVFKYIQNIEMDSPRKRNLLLSAIFHDIGKYECKSFTNYNGETTRYANFISHENVSSQIAILELKRLGVYEENIRDIVDLIQFHMDLNKKGDKVISRLEKLLTPEQIEDLVILHEADLSAK